MYISVFILIPVIILSLFFCTYGLYLLTKSIHTGIWLPGKICCYLLPSLLLLYFSISLPNAEDKAERDHRKLRNGIYVNKALKDSVEFETYAINWKFHKKKRKSNSRTDYTVEKGRSDGKMHLTAANLMHSYFGTELTDVNTMISLTGGNLYGAMYCNMNLKGDTLKLAFYKGKDLDTATTYVRLKNNLQ